MNAPRRRNLVFGWLLALACIVLFCIAGHWQLGRMREKQAMLDAVAQVMARRVAEPLLLASDPARLRDYDWAEGRATLTGDTLWLDNQTRGGKAGVRMYCLLLPDEGVQALLADAGWWPLQGDRRLPVFGCPSGSGLAVRGLLVAPPSGGLAQEVVQEQGAHRWLATTLDVQAIARATQQASGIAPRVLRLDPARAADDAGVMLAPGERDLDVLPNTISPERHLAYAVQWFGLAIAALVTALVLTFRRKAA